MKATLLICGICVSIFAIILDRHDESHNVGVGYFLLASSMILASALSRSEGLGDDRYRSMQHVYSALASGPIDMESLIKRLSGENDRSALEYYQAVIGRMLARRQIVICDGLVTLGEGMIHDA